MGLFGMFKRRADAAPAPRTQPRRPVRPADPDPEPPAGMFADELLNARLEAMSNEEVFEDAMVRGEVEVGGGDGSSLDEAVVIEAPDTLLGCSAQQLYLERRFGPRLHRAPSPTHASPPGWFMRKQTPVQRGVQQLEQVDIVLHDGQTRTLYFDISSYYGKEPELAIE